LTRIFLGMSLLIFKGVVSIEDKNAAEQNETIVQEILIRTKSAGSFGMGKELESLLRKMNAKLDALTAKVDVLSKSQDNSATLNKTADGENDAKQVGDKVAPSVAPDDDDKDQVEDRRLIEIHGGKADWDTGPDPEYEVENAFSTSASNAEDLACGGASKFGEGYLQSFPQHIWYEFPSSHTPVRMSFRFTEYRRPKKWRFIATQEKGCNEKSNWVELCGDKTGDKMRGPGKETGCDVPKDARQPYRCLGIRTYENDAGGWGRWDHSNCLKAMKFWENGNDARLIV